jgi:predicted aldo/keto reductase-like oxidoreductase
MAESVHRYAIEHGVNLVHVAWDYLGGQSIGTRRALPIAHNSIRPAIGHAGAKLRDLASM